MSYAWVPDRDPLVQTPRRAPRGCPAARSPRRAHPRRGNKTRATRSLVAPTLPGRWIPTHPPPVPFAGICSSTSSSATQVRVRTRPSTLTRRPRGFLRVNNVLVPSEKCNAPRDVW